MQKHRLSDFTRGWIIGNFAPSLLRTSEFEVGILTHKKGEIWPEHYHREATEYNVLLKGRMMVNEEFLQEGDVFVIEKNEISKPVFLKDCQVLVVKVPSVIGDKYNVI